MGGPARRGTEGRSEGARPIALVVSATLASMTLWGPAGCAALRTPGGDRFVHPKRGYSIRWPGPEWERIHVAKADLALRRPDGSTLTLIRRCGIPLAEPRVMARHLRFGLEEAHVSFEGPVATPWGDSAWEQRFEAQSDGKRVAVKAITCVRGRCVYDWVSTTAEASSSVEPLFDAWWRSFEPGPAPLESSRSRDGVGVAEPAGSAAGGVS